MEPVGEKKFVAATLDSKNEIIIVQIATLATSNFNINLFC